MFRLSYKWYLYNKKKIVSSLVKRLSESQLSTDNKNKNQQRCLNKTTKGISK